MFDSTNDASYYLASAYWDQETRCHLIISPSLQLDLEPGNPPKVSRSTLRRISTVAEGPKSLLWDTISENPMPHQLEIHAKGNHK